MVPQHHPPVTISFNCIIHTTGVIKSRHLMNFTSVQLEACEEVTSDLGFRDLTVPLVFTNG